MTILLPTQPDGEPPVPRGHVVTVVAARGGCGKTTVATNLAVTLAAGGARRVCLVDLDLAFGDVAIALQLEPERTIADAVALDRPIGAAGFRTLLTPYADGIDTLLAPIGPIAGEQIGRGLVRAILALARAQFDHVVVDTPPFYTDQVIAALDVADAYVLLATPDIAALKNLRLTLDLFNLRGYAEGARLVMLNRADDRTGLTVGDIEQVIRVPVRSLVPASRDVPISLNRGVPITVEAPDHPVSRAFRGFADECLGTRPPTEPAGRLTRLVHLRRRAVAR